MTSVVLKQKASADDLYKFIKNNYYPGRKELSQYMTTDVESEQIEPVSERTVCSRIKELTDKGKISLGKRGYYIPKKRKSKKKIQTARQASTGQDDSDQKKEPKTTPTISETGDVDVDAEIAQRMNSATILLDSTLLLLYMVSPYNLEHRNVISEAKRRCHNRRAAIGKKFAEFAHYVETSGNEYKKQIREICKGQAMFGAEQFRNLLSDIILRMRQDCQDGCSRLAERSIPYGDELSASFKAVATALNEMCRGDYDLVVDWYRYDEKMDAFVVHVSERKMEHPYKVTQVCWDGKTCVFDTRRGERWNAERIVLFYPAGPVEENSRHTVSIMLQCAEFSFEFEGKQETPSPSLDHIENDVAQIDEIHPQPEPDTMLTPEMGGRVQSTIESLEGKKFFCYHCSKWHPCKGWIGRPQDGEVPDKHGKEYWMYIMCRNTGRPMRLDRIESRLEGRR